MKKTKFNTGFMESFAKKLFCLSTIGLLVGLILSGELRQAQAAELMTNGSFEDGSFNGWTVNTTGIPFRPWQVTGAGFGGGYGMDTTSPQDGSFVAWNGFDGDGPMEFSMYQDVTIPAPVSATLTWQDRIQWNFALGGTAPKTYDVQVRDPATNALLLTLFTFSTGAPATNPTGDTGWVAHTADLSSFAGSTIRIWFQEEVPESFVGPAQIEFDNIRLEAEQPVIVVEIDIKPASFPNSIDLKSEGMQPVAILTTDDFDALVVDPITIELGDPDVGGTAMPIRSAAEDVDGDGDVDLVLKFSTAELVANGALSTNSQEALLTGATVDGIPIIGTDSVRIVP